MEFLKSEERFSYKNSQIILYKNNKNKVESIDIYYNTDTQPIKINNYASFLRDNVIYEEYYVQHIIYKLDEYIEFLNKVKEKLILCKEKETYAC